MAATNSKLQSIKTTSQILSDIAYKYEFSRVYDDFLMMTICVFSLGRMEDRYLEIAKRYQTDELKVFGKALAALIQEYENGCTADGGWKDVLGHIFEEHNGKFVRDALGQFFTPEALCDMMARINATGIPEQDEIKVMDPACGSGRCLIALSRMDPLYRYNQFYYGYDLDSRCVKMCVINMFMHGMKGVVIHMDTLRMEVFGGYRIYLPETGLGIMPLTKEQCWSFITEQGNRVEDKEPKPTINIDKPGPQNAPKSGQNRDSQQLSLFF